MKEKNYYVIDRLIQDFQNQGNNFEPACQPILRNEPLFYKELTDLSSVEPKYPLEYSSYLSTKHSSIEVYI